MAYTEFAWLFFARRDRANSTSGKQLAVLLIEHRPDIASDLSFTVDDPAFAELKEVFTILQRIKALW